MLMSSDRKQDVIRLTATDKPVPDIHLNGLPQFEPGWVWLVGAGPGDPGLLTLHAVNALQQADVVVYDALVSEDILKLMRPDAEKRYAGKRGGKPSWKQSDIIDTLISLAKEGKRVLRLKGGDPFVFGRGGEEAQALVEQNIAIRIIPGISAGIGGLAYAGIPVTHRDVNHAVTFITGHLAGDQVAEKMDWAAISRGSPVIVIYMAMRKLPIISALLIEAGRAEDDSVAIVTHATTSRQKVLVTTLKQAEHDVLAHGMEPPSIIVIGEVVNLQPILDWYQPK
jgi:uroporphyrin-III C-methyltransferase